MKTINKLNIVLIVMLILSLAFGPTSFTASAQVAIDSPVCQASASTLTGPAPLKVQFIGSSIVDSIGYAWFFGDGKSDVGSVVEKTYNAVGEYHVRLVCEEPAEGFYNHANMLIIIVTESENLPVQTPTQPAPTVGGNTSPTTGNGSEASGLIQGDNNFAPVVNGDNNEINITIEQTPVPTIPAPTFTPIVPDNSCSGYCAQSGGTININPPTQNGATTKTMPANFWAMIFYSIIDGISSPLENWKTWLVENK